MVTFNLGPLSRRSHNFLHLDEPGLSDDERNRHYEDLYHFNRRTCGYSWGLKKIERCVKKWGLSRPLSFLDLSSDGGGFSIALADWADKKLNGARLTFAPISAKGSPHAMERIKKRVQSVDLTGGLDPARFGLKAYDVITCFSGLERLERIEAVQLLRQVHLTASCGYFFSGWERDLRAFMLVKGATLNDRTGSFARDLALSVKRSFTANEMKGLAKEAGLEPVQILRQSGLRVLLMGERVLEFSPEVSQFPGLAGI